MKQLWDLTHQIRHALSIYTSLITHKPHANYTKLVSHSYKNSQGNRGGEESQGGGRAEGEGGARSREDAPTGFSFIIKSDVEFRSKAALRIDDYKM